MLDILYIFVDDQASESFEIPRILLVFHNDPFIRAWKRLGVLVDLSKKPKGTEKVESPTDTMVTVVEEEKTEEVEEEEEAAEEQEAPNIRNPNG